VYSTKYILVNEKLYNYSRWIVITISGQLTQSKHSVNLLYHNGRKLSDSKQQITLFLEQHGSRSSAFTSQHVSASQCRCQSARWTKPVFGKARKKLGHTKRMDGVAAWRYAFSQRVWAENWYNLDVKNLQCAAISAVHNNIFSDNILVANFLRRGTTCSYWRHVPLTRCLKELIINN